jgi:hypothetical protein
MRFFLAPAVLALLSSACTGDATSPIVDADRADGSDARLPDATSPIVDAGRADGSDAGLAVSFGPSTAPCIDPLSAEPFSSLSALPVAAFCADSSAQSQRSPDVTEVQCGPWIMVVEWTMVPTASFWIFDATTGALASVGAMVEGESWCLNGPPGYQLPSECFDPDPAAGPNLCMALDGGEVGDAGVEADAADD